MLINSCTGKYLYYYLISTVTNRLMSLAIDTTQVLLVPYEAKHVPTYHEWMKDEVRCQYVLRGRAIDDRAGYPTGDGV